MTDETPTVPATSEYPYVEIDHTTLPYGKMGVPESFIGIKRLTGQKVFIALPGTKTDGIGMIGTVEPGTQLFEGVPINTINIEARGRLISTKRDGNAVTAQVERVDVPVQPDAALTVLAKEALDAFRAVFGEQIRQKGSEGVLAQLDGIAETQPAVIADMIANSMVLPQTAMKRMLLAVDPKEQLELILDIIDDQARVLRRQKDFEVDDKDMEELLRKMGALPNQDESDDFAILEKKIAAAGMSDEARAKCEKELKKLRKMSDNDPNKSKTQEYIESVLELPWTQFTKTETDLKKVQATLDAGHYGLEDVKERVIEDVAKQLQTGKPSGSIICLTGEPGVGKTSIAKGVAEATGREIVIVKLGGVSDEADIRGFSTTYVGAIEGRIMKAMKKAKTMNPIIVLDEIDKMGSGSGRGDPASALLEVLDPAQNNAFVDRYMGFEYDLSNVMFVGTANFPDQIPAPLYDRMEVIDLKGYSDEGKMAIAKDHLIPKHLETNNLSNIQFSITDEALKALIDGYTYEPGVRSLEKLVDKLMLKTVVKIQEDKAHALPPVKIEPEDLEKELGPKKIERELANPEPCVGHVNGLAVTGATGSVLPIEAIKIDRRYKPEELEATGNLEQTIAESVRYADAFVASNAKKLGIPPEEYEENGVHIKVDRGGVPKDGPSAGLAITTLLTSVRTGIPIRGDVAMTGEISVFGESGKIGGLDHKLDGAFKSGIKTVLFPAANLKDITEDPTFPKKLKENLLICDDASKVDAHEPVPEGKMRVIAVKNIWEVLDHALDGKLKPLAAEPTPATGNNPLMNLNESQLEKLLALADMFSQVAPRVQPAAANDAQVPAASQQASDASAQAKQKRRASAAGRHGLRIAGR